MITLPSTRRLTVDEYHDMVAKGLLDDQRVELIDGEIRQMPPQQARHFSAIHLAHGVLTEAFGPGHWIRMQGPLQQGGLSEPEPDVAVVPGGPDDYPQHPSSALLIVEVSDSSLAFDRNEKASLYASRGIADCWVVNLQADVLEVHRDPVPDPARRFGHRYSSVTTLRPGEQVRPLAASGWVRVAELFPRH